jgi:hypothetical protein
MQFHVRFSAGLSPPNLHDTKEAAHEFWLARHEENETSYTLEHVSPLKVGDLLTMNDLVGNMRENLQRLTGDDSFMDSDEVTDKLRELEMIVSGAMNNWSQLYGLFPDGMVVRDSSVVKL